MAKRFTDTAKWDKSWFRKLPTKMKCLWIFLCDRCDHAGVWEYDSDAFEYFIGENVSKEEILENLGDKIEFVGADKLIIISFIDFQYGNLNPSNRVHQSVIQRLEKLIKKPLTSPLQGAKDKDKDKDKDKKGGVGEKTKPAFDFEAPYSVYPRKEGKEEGIVKLQKTIKTPEDYILFCKAVEHYADNLKVLGTDTKFMIKWSNFASKKVGKKICQPWRDYIEPIPIKQAMPNNLIGIQRNHDQNELETQAAIAEIFGEVAL